MLHINYLGPMPREAVPHPCLTLTCTQRGMAKVLKGKDLECAVWPLHSALQVTHSAGSSPIPNLRGPLSVRGPLMRIDVRLPRGQYAMTKGPRAIMTLSYSEILALLTGDGLFVIGVMSQGEVGCRPSFYADEVFPTQETHGLLPDQVSHKAVPVLAGSLSRDAMSLSAAREALSDWVSSEGQWQAPTWRAGLKVRLQLHGISTALHCNQLTPVSHNLVLDDALDACVPHLAMRETSDGAFRTLEEVYATCPVQDRFALRTPWADRPRSLPEQDVTRLRENIRNLQITGFWSQVNGERWDRSPAVRCQSLLYKAAYATAALRYWYESMRLTADDAPIPYMNREDRHTYPVELPDYEMRDQILPVKELTRVADFMRALSRRNPRVALALERRRHDALLHVPLKVSDGYALHAQALRAAKYQSIAHACQHRNDRGWDLTWEVNWWKSLLAELRGMTSMPQSLSPIRFDALLSIASARSCLWDGVHEAYRVGRLVDPVSLDGPMEVLGLSWLYG